MSTNIQISQFSITFLARNTCATKLHAVQKLSMKGKEASVFRCNKVPMMYVKAITAKIDIITSLLVMDKTGLLASS